MGNAICCAETITCDNNPCFSVCGGGSSWNKDVDDDTLVLTDDSEEFHSVYSRSTTNRRSNRSRASNSLFGESDVWYDALMEHDWLVGEETFDVTDEELDILKKHLAEKFPGADSDYLSDAYIRSVASKPYSKNMSIRRPLEYTMEKLDILMEWRKSNYAPDITTNWINLACQSQNGENPDPENVSKEQWNTIKLMVDTLNRSSTYIHGLTKTGQPIIWIRTNRKQWYANADSESNMLILLLDSAIKQGMAKEIINDSDNEGEDSNNTTTTTIGGGVTDFVIISHSYKPPPPHPKAVYKMLNGLVKGYPDRMNVLISAPVSSIVEFIMSLLIPLMPGRLAEKFVFLSMDHIQERLNEFLLNGIDDIPTFLNGTNTEHDLYYPDNNNYNPATTRGILKFDYYGMVERLKQQKEMFEEKQQRNNKHVSFAANGEANGSTATNGDIDGGEEAVSSNNAITTNGTTTTTI